MTLKEFEQTLTEMSLRSKAFTLVKAEMIKRGYWKNKPRGIPQKPAILNKNKQQLTAASIHIKRTFQVNEFGDIEYD